MNDLAAIQRGRERVRVICRGCDHVAFVTPLELLKDFAANATLDGVAARLRCSSCKARNPILDVMTA
jgi:hypothetical protein